MPSAFVCDQLLGPDGWIAPALLEIDDAGFVNALRNEAPFGAARLSGPVVPGMPNLHSHAVQRMMAGSAERAGSANSFWSWREVLYRFVERLDPDDIEAAAAQSYVEMLENGYTSVAEFHYLHLDRNGRPYADVAELSERIVRAAERVGIGLTLLPVLYTSRGFGGAPLEPAQRRFALRVDEFARLFEVLHARHGSNSSVRIGAAPHSLRAVPPDAFATSIEAVTAIDPSSPLHVHAAEQLAEVDACVRWSGLRPVAWLLEHAGIDQRWCVVHATHLDELECERLARSGAVVGLCPTTEANLGDGIFGLRRFLDAGGTFGIGSDSNLSTSPLEELRWLEYGQRLRERRRNVVADERDSSTGSRLWTAALFGGARALGQPIGSLAPGSRADLVVLDADHPSLVDRTGSELLDSTIFSTTRCPVRDVMVSGRFVVKEGRHVERDAVAGDYRRALGRVRSR